MDENTLNNTIAEMQRRIQLLESKIGNKPSSIKSPSLMQKIVEKFNVDANLADDIVLMLKTNQLKTDAEILDFINKKTQLQEQAKANKNIRGESQEDIAKREANSNV